MDQIFTHYSVNQFPDRNGLPDQDKAMDEFRSLFPVPTYRAIVSPDGIRMVYSLRATLLMENYLKMARMVIATRQLPLEASQERHSVQGVVFQNNLVITYSPR